MCNCADKIITDFILGRRNVEVCGGGDASPFRFFKCECGKEVFLLTKKMAQGLHRKPGLPMQFIKKIYWKATTPRQERCSVTAFPMELARNPYSEPTRSTEEGD